MITKWINHKMIIPFEKILKNGVSVEKLSVSLAMGITVGIMPLYGFTTILVFLIVISLRLNMVASQIAHYLVYPVQLALMIPFMKLGDIFIRKSVFTFSIHEYLKFFKTDFWNAVHQFWLLNLSAFIIWLILAVPLFISLYFLLRYFMKKYFHGNLRKSVL